MRHAALAALVALGCHPAGQARMNEPRHDGMSADARAIARVRAALTAIDARSFEADVERLEGPRNMHASTHALRSISYVEDELSRAGFTIERQRVRDAALGEVNVVAGREGGSQNGTSRGERVVVASAHLDTVPSSPGADDDASGIATLLAIARAVRGVPTAHSIRLIAFGLEEEGLRGSRHYVRSLGRDERARIIAVYNFDMVAFLRRDPGSQAWPEHADILADVKGRPLPTAGTFIGAVTIASADHSPLHALHEAQAFEPHLHVETLELPPVLLRFAPDLARGDHASFWKAGIPAIAIGDTAELRNPNYHRPTDTLATLDVAFGAQVARWAAAAVLLAAKPL